jgi:hypothetical protein
MGSAIAKPIRAFHGEADGGFRGACHRAGQRPDPVGRPDGKLWPDPWLNPPYGENQCELLR